MQNTNSSLDYIFYVDLIVNKSAPQKSYDELTEMMESLYNACNHESISITKKAPLLRLHYNHQMDCKLCSMWIKFSKSIQEEPNKNDNKYHSTTIANNLTKTLNDENCFIRLKNITPVEVSYKGWCE